MSRGNFGVLGIFLVILYATFTKKLFRILNTLTGSDVLFPFSSLILFMLEAVKSLLEIIDLIPDHSFFIF